VRKGLELHEGMIPSLGEKKVSFEGSKDYDVNITFRAEFSEVIRFQTERTSPKEPEPRRSINV
jgi:hypothetical protein